MLGLWIDSNSVEHTLGEWDYHLLYAIEAGFADLYEAIDAGWIKILVNGPVVEVGCNASILPRLERWLIDSKFITKGSKLNLMVMDWNKFYTLQMEDVNVDGLVSTVKHSPSVKIFG